MDWTDTQSQNPHEPADGCAMGPRLSAYADGELDPTAAQRVKLHLATCDACRAELDDIRELSSLAGHIGSEGISHNRLRRIHWLIDADQRSTVLRFAVATMSIAASVVIIGGVWLSELPVVSTSPQVVLNPYTLKPGWEQTAVNFETRPGLITTGNLQTEPVYADAEVADMILDGLSGKPR